MKYGNLVEKPLMNYSGQMGPNLSSDEKNESRASVAAFGMKVKERKERARIKRSQKAEAKRAEKIAAGVPVSAKRKTRPKSGSDRRSEARTRQRMADALAALREDLANFSRLVQADQTLVAKLEEAPARVQAREALGLSPAPHPTLALTEYQALLSHMNYMLKDFEGLLKQLDGMESRPRMERIVPLEEATTDDYVVSMIDGTHFQVMTRSLRQYGISASDYRRLFGLPDDYMLWTEKVKQARSEIISESRVWEKHKNRKKPKEP